MDRAIQRVGQFGKSCCILLGESPLREAIAELLATFVLVLIGDSVMATCVLGGLEVHSLLIGALGWGLALMCAVTIAGSVSGGHVNPAVTIGLACGKKCGWEHVIPNVVAQLIGSFLAAWVVYVTYGDAINKFDGGMRQLPPSAKATAQIFATYPQAFASLGTCVFDQVLGTALLLMIICGATKRKNLNFRPRPKPMLIGFGLTAVVLGLGYNCGAPLNPARDFAPRFFTSIFGWGPGVFSYNKYHWFSVPIIAPIIGGIIGVWLYKLMVEVPGRFNDLNFLDELDVGDDESPATPADAPQLALDINTRPEVAGKNRLSRQFIPTYLPTTSRPDTLIPIEQEEKQIISSIKAVAASLKR